MVISTLNFIPMDDFVKELYNNNSVKESLGDGRIHAILRYKELNYSGSNIYEFDPRINWDYLHKGEGCVFSYFNAYTEADEDIHDELIDAVALILC